MPSANVGCDAAYALDAQPTLTNATSSKDVAYDRASAFLEALFDHTANTVQFSASMPATHPIWYLKGNRF